MSRPRLTSTSTRDAGAPPARKNRRRTAPVTSTMSSTAQAATERRTRPEDQAGGRSTVDALECAVWTGRGTTTRNVQTVSPLGSTRS